MTQRLKNPPITRNGFQSNLAPPGRADLYNCRTRSTRTLRSVRAAKEAAMHAYRADHQDQHWILMSPDGELYRSKEIERHCGRPGRIASLTWVRFEKADLAAMCRVEEAGDGER